MRDNGSALLNASQQVPGSGEDGRPRPSWLASTLASILIFTIVVDILGNLLVILSVYRNKKLRNAGRAPSTSPNASPLVGQQEKFRESVSEKRDFESFFLLENMGYLLFNPPL